MFTKKRRVNGFSVMDTPHLVTSTGAVHSTFVSLDDIINVAEGETGSYYANSINNSEYIFLHVNSFGTHKLYKLVSTKKLMDFIRSNPEAAHHETVYCNPSVEFVKSKDPEEVTVMYYGLFDQDVPATEHVNFKSRLVPINTIPLGMLLMMMTQKHMVDGLNAFYEKYNSQTRAHFGFSRYKYDIPEESVIDEYGSVVTEPNDMAMFCYNHALASTVLDGDIPFEELIPDFSPDEITPGKYKFFIENTERIWFSNNLNVSRYHRLMIYIPEFDLWQEISANDLNDLQRMETFKISYARVNAPRCYDKVWFNTEFAADNVEDLLFNAVAIPTDIAWHSLFHWQRTDTSENKPYRENTPEDDTNKKLSNPFRPKEYEALGFDVSCYDYNMNLLLTQEELGINNPHYRKAQSIGIDYGPAQYNGRRSDFSLIDLIIQIMHLRPSMGIPFQEGNDDANYS